MTKRTVSPFARHMRLMLANNPSISMLQIANHWKNLSDSERERYKTINHHSQPLLETRSAPTLVGKDEETDLETQSCIICMTNKKVVALVPCGHTCYCISCSKSSGGKRLSNTCPICRAQVVTAIVVRM